MRTRKFLLIAVAFLSMVNGSLAGDVPNVTKSVLLRSKEMKPYTTEVKVYKNGMDDVDRKTVEKQRYEEYLLKIELY